jgi:hypothetical protein
VPNSMMLPGSGTFVPLMANAWVGAPKICPVAVLRINVWFPGALLAAKDQMVLPAAASFSSYRFIQSHPWGWSTEIGVGGPGGPLVRLKKA